MVARRPTRQLVRVLAASVVAPSSLAIVPAESVAAATDRLPDLRAARIRDLRVETLGYRADDGDPHEADIDAVSEAGIMAGCGERRFCPTVSVTRGAAYPPPAQLVDAAPRFQTCSPTRHDPIR